MPTHQFMFQDCLTYSLEEKMKYKVFETDEYVFLKLPGNDEEFVCREGIDMQHCLAYDHASYCRRMRLGEIEVYSMTRKSNNTPVVDIEVALTKGSYSLAKVTEPVITQIRGIRNECPPRDEYILPLSEFFAFLGYRLVRHDVRNFDGQLDGVLFEQAAARLAGPINVE